MLLLLLPLLWGIKCVGGWRSQAGAGAPTNLWSPKGSWGLDDRYQLQVQKSVAVKEGVCVFIPCTFSYPTSYWRVSTPVLGYWFRKGANNIIRNRDAPVATNNPHGEVKEETKGRFHLLGDLQNGSCSLVIRDAQKRDTAVYFFQAEKGNHVRFSFMKYKLSLQVTGTELARGGLGRGVTVEERHGRARIPLSLTQA
nr:sialic acid-binding Ig-like lectin 12 [Loxodonta africana]